MIHKKFRISTGTTARRPKLKAKASENPAINAELAEKEFKKSKHTRETTLLKSNPSYTYLSLYHH